MIIFSHKHLIEKFVSLGADRAILPIQCGDEKFDIVFECTGNPDGLRDAINRSKNSIF
jgi:threonine dehydrogenase-like Zn-dependent dehydrogenase